MSSDLSIGSKKDHSGRQHIKRRFKPLCLGSELRKLGVQPETASEMWDPEIEECSTRQARIQSAIDCDKD
jgi:hypothetical protein